MNKRSVLTGVALLAAGFALSAQAADPVAGKKKFDATCIACHGQQGISQIPMYPNLVGQKEQYLITSLRAFRDGKRKDDAMSPMAAGLTNVDIADLAAYVSRLKIADGKNMGMPTEGAGDVVAGRKLYNATCVACHGPDGIAVAQLYPDLGGQKEQYLVKAIHAFRDGTRLDPIMQPMAKHLTDTQIADLAAYLSHQDR